MNRREFFKSLAIGAAVIAIPSAALKALAANPADEVALAAVETQAPLTLRALQQAFYECSVGKECPSQILLSVSTWEKFRSLYPLQDLYSNPTRWSPHYLFHHAAVCGDPNVPDDTVVVINERHPDDPGLNKCFRLDEI
jgi:hypothetical protein